MSTADLLTVAGLSIVTTLIVKIITSAWKPTADQIDRFGPLLAVVVALVVAIPAALYTGADPIQAVLTALIAGSSAAGIYDVTKTTVSAVRGQ